MCHVHSTVRTLKKCCSVTVLKHDSVIDTHNMNVLILTILSYWCQIGAVEHFCAYCSVWLKVNLDAPLNKSGNQAFGSYCR